MRPVLHFALWRLHLVKAQTQTTDAERAALARHASGRARLVEIGVWHGVTTQLLRAAMAEAGELWAVDPFPRGRLGISFQEQVAHREVASVDKGRVHWVKTTGAEAGAMWAREGLGQADFLFIDGDHRWEVICEDWTAWNGLIVEGGIVALHDSRSTAARPIDDAGTVRFTQAVVLKDPRYRLVDEVDSLTVLERVRH